jgi:hypothetical protein
MLSRLGVHHRVVSLTDDRRDSLMLCGYCSFDAAPNDPLMHALPPFILLRDEDFARCPWLTRTLDHLSAEYMASEPGSALTVNKLTEVLLVQLLRIDFGRKDKTGIIGALADPRLARLLDAVHEAPAGTEQLRPPRAVAPAGTARDVPRLTG